MAAFKIIEPYFQPKNFC